MLSNPRNVLLFMALASGALVTGFLARDPAPPVTETSDLGPAQQGYYLQGAVIRETDENGEFSHRLVAERVEQFDEDSQIEFVGLRVEYLPDDESRWNVYALAATAPASRDTFDLKEDVRLNFASNDGLNEVVIETTVLHLDTENARVETDRPISITNLRTGSVTTATGLELDLDSREMKLLSEVKSRGTL